MKKVTAFIFSVALLILTISPIVQAQNYISDDLYDTCSFTEYFEDGSYTVTTIKQSPAKALSAYSAVYTKIGEKHVDLFSSDDELQWEYTLIGTFQVNEGVSAVCTNSTYSSKIHVSGWSLITHDNTYSNNIARGTATYKKKVLFITTNTHDVEVAIGCDKYGNVG